MRIDEVLIGANLVTLDDIAAAQRRQVQEGGDIASNLVALGIVSQATLDRVVRISPPEPTSLDELDIKESDLLDLAMKLIQVQGLETSAQIAQAIKLPLPLAKELADIATSRQLIRVTSARGAGSLAEQRYQITEAGRDWAEAAKERSHYIGPCPVSLEDFREHILLQKITNDRVTLKDLTGALDDLCFPEELVRKIGPALNSGRPVLFYGPPGNGKTSVAVRLGRILSKLTYVPYAVMIEGQVMRVFDSKLHFVLRANRRNDDGVVRSLKEPEYDERWIPCRQPFVVAGGELTLEMLELAYDPISKFYEAPLHVKALGGSILIDDYGRQLVSPADLLNRWIVPLENGVDYLKLQTGKSFDLPFEARLMFSTNMEPEDLMDPAFLRRLPFKLEIAPPSHKRFKKIFRAVAKSQNLLLTEETLDSIIQELTENRGIELAAYQPAFITEQIVATCEFEGIKPHFEQRLIEAAISNIRVKRYHPAKPAAPST